MTPRRPQLRRGVALALAVGAHLLTLMAMGWRIPKGPPEQAQDTLPPLEVQLVRPLVRERPQTRPASPKPAPSPPSASARVLVAPTPGAPTLSAPVQSPPAPAVAAGPRDCAPEDLPLLTDAEKALCRNEIDADKERRLARGADARAAKEVAEARRGPQTYRMSKEKEAYYAAVADAYEQQTRGPPMAGRHPEVHCLGGKPANSLKIGPLPCYVTPPQGFLTEESGIAPP